MVTHFWSRFGALPGSSCAATKASRCLRTSACRTKWRARSTFSMASSSLAVWLGGTGAGATQLRNWPWDSHGAGSLWLVGRIFADLVVSNGFLIVKNPTWDGHRNWRIPNGPAEKSLAECWRIFSGWVYLAPHSAPHLLSASHRWRSSPNSFWTKQWWVITKAAAALGFGAVEDLFELSNCVLLRGLWCT